MFAWVFLVLLVAVAAYGIALYNSLVRQRQMVREGWSGIDVQLKRRSDLIPNLVETVKGYVTHERDTLEKVVELRNSANSVPAGDIEGRARAEGALSAALGRLFALAEAYPDLKASANFAELQGSIERTEHDLQMARRYYNGAARDLNVAVESFPSNLVARQFGFEAAPFFEIEDPADRQVPKVAF
ncbi:MAG TPA: LemA family protein [Methylomirabilota bacterium]|nr:LemA family protein [Methylomirabilota bacterium]